MAGAGRPSIAGGAGDLVTPATPVAQPPLASSVTSAITEEGLRARLGALDIPVPYSQPLELATIPNADKIAAAARGLQHEATRLREAIGAFS